jgi:hypothetical protein
VRIGTCAPAARAKRADPRRLARARPVRCRGWAGVRRLLCPRRFGPGLGMRLGPGNPRLDRAAGVLVEAEWLENDPSGEL